MNEKKIFTKRMALYLRQCGLPIIRTEPNKCKPEFDVYIFKNSFELQTAISEYMNRR